jgi:hypothetical protein
MYDLGIMKITAAELETLKRQIRSELASRGGKARAAKYSKATLRKWAALGGPKGSKGGRPRKDRSKP